MHGRDDDARPQQIEGATKPSRIALLNDDFRCRCAGGTLAVTAGVIALGPDALPCILELVRGFAAFTPDNDAYEEHDLGALTWRGERLFWKMDCYDREMRFGSPNPADPAVTSRVLTIMLAEEW